MPLKCIKTLSPKLKQASNCLKTKLNLLYYIHFYSKNNIN